MTKKFRIALTLALVLAAICLTPMVLGQAAQPEQPATAEVVESAPEAAPEVVAPEAEVPAETATDTPEAAAPEAAAPSNDFSTMSDDFVLVTVNGEAITKADMSALYDQMMQQYASYGMDFSTAENQQALLSYVMSIMMQQTLINQKATELGLDKFTDEELEAMRASSQASYDNVVTTYKGYFAAEGKTDEAVETEVLDYLKQAGYSVDSLIKQAQESEIAARVYAHATKDVVVTDADAEAGYQKKVEEAKALYAQTPSQFDTDISSGATIYYTPEGYRSVKHILVMFDKAADLQALYSTLNGLAEDDPARAETQAQIDEMLSDIQPKLDEIQARIDAGDDFQALIDEYGEDGGMKTSPTSETGYYMNKDTATFVPEFTQGGMALEKVGDISAPILTTYGFHIIRYNSDLPSGETPYAQVKDAFATTFKEEAMNAAFSSAMNEWGTASTIEYGIQ